VAPKVGPSSLQWGEAAAAHRDLYLSAQKLAFSNSDPDKSTTAPPFIR
jgi:hypothetical protein